MSWRNNECRAFGSKSNFVIAISLNIKPWKITYIIYISENSIDSITIFAKASIPSITGESWAVLSLLWTFKTGKLYSKWIVMVAEHFTIFVTEWFQINWPSVYCKCVVASTPYAIMLDIKYHLIKKAYMYEVLWSVYIKLVLLSFSWPWIFVYCYINAFRLLRILFDQQLILGYLERVLRTFKMSLAKAFDYL